MFLWRALRDIFEILALCEVSMTFAMAFRLLCSYQRNVCSGDLDPQSQPKFETLYFLMSTFVSILRQKLYANKVFECIKKKKAVYFFTHSKPIESSN